MTTYHGGLWLSLVVGFVSTGVFLSSGLESCAGENLRSLSTLEYNKVGLILRRVIVFSHARHYRIDASNKQYRFLSEWYWRTHVATSAMHHYFVFERTLSSSTCIAAVFIIFVLVPAVLTVAAPSLIRAFKSSSNLESATISRNFGLYEQIWPLRGSPH